MGRSWVVFFFWGCVGICLFVSVSCDDTKQVDDTDYICTNGVPIFGRSANNGEERCSVCHDGYHLSGRAGAEHTACEANTYVCTNGMPTFGGSANNGEERCSVCDNGYHFSGVAGAEHTVCEANTYVCTNGMPMFERPRVNEQEGCISCNNRFTLTTTNRCAVHDFTGLMCVSDSDCGGRGMGLYCDDIIHDDDPRSGQCEPLRDEGDICGKNVSDPLDSYSRVCQNGLKCNGIDGVSGICTNESLGAPCTHNGFHVDGNPNPRNDGLHCKRSLYCDLFGVSQAAHLIGECKAAPSDQGESELTAHVLTPPGGTVNGSIHYFDVDYFSIVVPDKGSLNTRLSTMSGSGITLKENILRFFGSRSLGDTTLLAGGSAAGSISQLLSVPVNSPGTYYIKVDADHTTLRLGLYDYQLEVFFDRSGNRSDASMITDGSSTSEGLSSAGDVDYFVINVPSSKILRAYTTGSIDTVGDIEDISGVSFVSDDNSGQGDNFDISYNALARGNYYIKVTGATGHRLGTYSLMVSLSSLPDLHNDTLSGATRVIAGSTTQGSLFPNDEDYFVINVPSNKILRAYIAGSTGIIGEIRNNSDTTLVDDNDGNFDLSYIVLNAGDYYIWVRKPYRSSNSNIEAYSLQVSVGNTPMINDNHGDTVSDATMINMASTAGSMSETPGTLHINDTDYFLLDVTPPALASVLFVCVYTTDAAGMMGIPIRVGTSRGMGVTLSNGAANASTFTYLPGIPRSIAVWSTTTGDYRLHVKIGNCPP